MNLFRVSPPPKVPCPSSPPSTTVRSQSGAALFSSLELQSLGFFLLTCGQLRAVLIWGWSGLHLIGFQRSEIRGDGQPSRRSRVRLPVQDRPDWRLWRRKIEHSVEVYAERVLLGVQVHHRSWIRYQDSPGELLLSARSYPVFFEGASFELDPGFLSSLVMLPVHLSNLLNSNL